MCGHISKISSIVKSVEYEVWSNASAFKPSSFQLVNAANLRDQLEPAVKSA